HALAGVQPGIVAEAIAWLEIVLDPARRRIFHDVLDGEQRSVDLLARLQGVAAVDEQRGTFHQDDRGPRRAGEAGEPGEALLALAQIFILMAVGSRQDEAGQVAVGKLGAQRRDARGAGGAVGVILERLETSFEHGGNLWGGPWRGNGRLSRAALRVTL